jgi:transposase
MTGLVNLDTGRLWDLFEGRSKAVLAERLRLLGNDVVAIETVVIDPYAGYKAAVRELAPGAVRVADRFHIERLATQALTDVRCRRQQKLTGHRGRIGDPLYAVRRDLVRGRERLSERGLARLSAAFRADRSDELECAWLLKEMLRDLYQCSDRSAATAALADWHDWAARYDVDECNRLATTLRSWEPELLAYFDTGLTNGATEGRNLIVKSVKRQGFGYRNPDHYRLRVLYRCG